MKIKELKRISIRDYLAKQGFNPKRDRNYYGMYFSPFREESVPSLKVDFNKNLWIDFGSGEGGTVIDMVMKLGRCTFIEAVRKLESYASGYVISYPLVEIKSKLKKNSLIEIVAVQQLANKSLISYLNERRINIDVARAYCPEVYYNVNGKTYYAIGFENVSSGYELRNRYFKGSTSKDISLIRADNQICSVFEGFFDFLSYLTMNDLPKHDENIIVLNTVYNLNKAIRFLSTQELIKSYFDNDRKGVELSIEISRICKNAISQSDMFRGYKDLNEYLCRFQI